MNIINTQIDIFKDITNVNGKINKNDFWNKISNTLLLMGLSIGLFLITLLIVCIIPNVQLLVQIVSVLIITLYVLCFLGFLSLGIKRLHDAALPRALILLVFIPIVNLYLIYLFTKDSSNKKIIRKKNETFAHYAYRYFL